MSLPFINKQFTFTQPDGTKLNVVGTGDQHYASFYTADGTPIVRDPLTGYYQIAAVENDQLRPSGVQPTIAGANSFLPIRSNFREDAEVKKSKAHSHNGLPLNDSRWQQRRREAKIETLNFLINRGAGAAPPKRETVGTYIGIVLPIDFPDVRGTISITEIENFCNKKGYTGFGNNGSVFDYFFDNSNGKLHYTNIVAPYYTAKNPRRYYANDSLDCQIRSIELIEEALAFHKRNGFDFSMLTSDTKDYVYAVNVFYAGPVVNSWTKGLWPHQFHLNRPFPLSGSKNAYDYQITNMGQELSLGTFCHENGHMICDFPDLYDYGADSKGVGIYCLMCAGGSINSKNPSQIGAYLKFKAGWSVKVESIAAGSKAKLASNTNHFIISKRSETEYFILENRQIAARDESLPSHGIAIWHVDENGSNNDQQMTLSNHYECRLIQADGKNDLEKNINYGDSTDLFHADTRSEIGAGTQPALKWWDGSAPGIELTQISKSGTEMSFLVK